MILITGGRHRQSRRYNVQYGVNIKLVSADNTDPYSSTATLRVGNLSVDKVFGPTPADISRPGVYTFTYTVGLFNRGVADTNATVTMTLPAGLYFVSGGPSGSTMLPLSGTVGIDRQFVWSGYSLPASTPITFTMVATTEAKLYDLLKTWTAKADVDDGVDPVTHRRLDDDGRCSRLAWKRSAAPPR